jgi:hypothetical protein
MALQFKTATKTGQTVMAHAIMEQQQTSASRTKPALKTDNACKHPTATKNAMESVIATESAMAPKPRHANANKNASKTATLTRSTAIATKTDVDNKRHLLANQPQKHIFFLRKQLIFQPQYIDRTA